ncbi:MAG: hypothetical protein JWP91_2307 [Fibrobacteres bacterium]|nr:hypothetical protein [Fibrobacterota bacterium]
MGHVWRILAVTVLLSGAARADERMNAMIGLWYGPYNSFSFEYDLIAQFFKSQEWMGNITGPYVSEEIGLESNRFGVGFATGRRMNEKGTFAMGATLFGQNKWERFSETDMGAEARLSLFVFGAKLSLIENWKKLYWQVGFSY